jgi:alkylation response protein AidB-like acyl-CoA dehydrogenase
MDFHSQIPPRLGNQYDDDPWLRSYLRRTLPSHVLASIEASLSDLGAQAGGELYEATLRGRLSEPVLTRWDAWGNRVDTIELSPVWRQVAPLATRAGLVAIPYEHAHGRHSRIHQFAAVYLFHPSSEVYTCPLAMTDGAVRTLLAAGNRRLIERAVPRLTSRDPQRAWTSGQWMTETTGGSDVGASRTIARELPGEGWQLEGRKWFTSAITADMALTLARPVGSGPGGSNLALFYVETRDAAGRSNGIRVERLKDKLGTRKVPTAELILEGTLAEPVAGLRDGTRHIAPMLTVTRAWNAVTAVAFMRRGVALARAYAQVRNAFGKPLAAQPLHVDTLAGLEAETRGAFLLAFQVVELLGRDEAGEIDDGQRALLKLLTPIVKLVTAKQAVVVASEVLEAFGGAGYVEDTGLPALLRDAQVLPIWEGTTNVLALDALLRSDVRAGLAALLGRVSASVRAARDTRLVTLGRSAIAAVERAAFWLDSGSDETTVQAGARRLALTLGRALELALLIEHAQWLLDREADSSGVATARRFATAAVDLLADLDPADARLLLGFD